jgi:hypothetical protein
MTTKTEVLARNQQTFEAYYEKANLNIETAQKKHLGKGQKWLSKDDFFSYDKEIKARVEGIRAKVLAAKTDPKQGWDILTIATKELRQLDAFTQQFWAGRKAAAQMGLNVANQIACVDTTLSKPLPPLILDTTTRSIHAFSEVFTAYYKKADHSINAAEQKHLVKGQRSLSGDDLASYDLAIRTRVEKIRAKALSARKDATQGWDILSSAAKELDKLETFTKTFWDGREAAKKMDINVAEQITTIDAALSKALPSLVLPGAAVGASATVVYTVVRETLPGGLGSDIGMAVDRIAQRIVVGTVVGALGGGIAELLFNAKEAH